ncbi:MULTISPECIES: hypothetical protein [unclassified Marinovum]
MTRDSDTGRTGKKPRKDDREARLKAALKANMGRRKAQARARAEQTDAPDDKNEKKD